MSAPRILIYLLRRDLRVADNPVFTEISRLCQQSQHTFTHLLPLYIFPAQQVEVSGFLSSDSEQSPYPEARSPVGGFWRCGPHRARFLAESVWDTKKSLGCLESGLELRVGRVGEVVKNLLEAYQKEDGEIVGVWMTEEEGLEEKQEERAVRTSVQDAGKEFRLWADEKYLVDDRDLPFNRPQELPDVFTSFRKMVEPLRDAPRRALPKPGKLPPLPTVVPRQPGPFTIPNSLDDTISALLKPLEKGYGLQHPPKWPESAKSAHPFHGGEITAHQRIKHLVTSGSMSGYKDSRNGLLGEDFSTKLSAWLALGCVSARQIHEYLLDFEDGKTELGKGVQGYGKGENKGSSGVRFELLWRDYMRLCTRKFGPRLFRVEGFKNDTSTSWKYPGRDPEAKYALQRFLEGRTGAGLIDASMRELYLTGYTSNRARQNVASYLAKHLGVDWRNGAEWYESLLADYDVSNNWGNWQYVAGVGNDPRGEARVFNPVKQAFDYDPNGDYVRNWVVEVRELNDLQAVFQAWTLDEESRHDSGLDGIDWVEMPLKRIHFQLGRGGGRGRGSGRGRGGEKRRAGGGNAYRVRGRGDRNRGQGWSGKMDKAQAAGENL
ncbi:MAG: hypothetical protein M1836_001785 [Candelina mexicana]|nr:MAG: hypothetical protein M1836_001785 [Candelina mexicana]